MKVSFSLSSSKDSSKPATLCSSADQHDQSAKKEFITEFDPSKTLTDSNSKNPIVIPPIPNEWNPQKQVMSIDIPVEFDHPNLQFEVDRGSTFESVVSNITYGLNLRDKKGSGSDTVSSIDRLMLMKLKSDLKRLPDDRGLEEFDDVSVGDFARAYLEGYGWHEGRGIGKNAKEDVKVVEYTNRATREGLGFVRTNDGDHRIVKSKKGVNNGGKRVAFCEGEWLD